MQPSEITCPQVHDLLQLDPDLLQLAGIGAPNWVREALALCPWVVVRRAEAPTGQIAVGVRGSSRSERWGSFISKDLIRKVLQPAELITLAQSLSLRTPPFLALHQLSERWCDLTLSWGPTGSVGFELASGRQATTKFSDLDIAIRAETKISPELARSLWDCTLGLQTRVDIRVETRECGFSLEEYTRTFSPILLRYPDGVRLGGDPWAKALRAVEGAG